MPHPDASVAHWTWDADGFDRGMVYRPCEAREAKRYSREKSVGARKPVIGGRPLQVGLRGIGRIMK